MVRKILGIIIGYIAMVVFVFITFSAAYLFLGTEGSFRPNSYEVSTVWIIFSIILGFIGAVIGGLICFAIGRSTGASAILAVIVLILGLIMAIPTLSSEEVAQSMFREGPVGTMEAMQKAHQPTWLALLNPLIGAAGIMVGSRLKKKSPAVTESKI
jgi:uncharacterized membrane protein YeaQ/YmgE (transglycosylase-associated protein family)